MNHMNPIQKNQPVGKKFITMGEIMLRLTPPNYDKIRMATSFEASYGGSEANIALALASLKVDSTFFSVVLPMLQLTPSLSTRFLRMPMALLQLKTSCSTPALPF